MFCTNIIPLLQSNAAIDLEKLSFGAVRNKHFFLHPSWTSSLTLEPEQQIVAVSHLLQQRGQNRLTGLDWSPGSPSKPLRSVAWSVLFRHILAVVLSRVQHVMWF